MTITVVTPVSPIPSHPDTSILEQTVASVRHHLPGAEIILTFDGVRPEQEHRRPDYEEAIRRTLWLADKSWGNVCPFVFDEHLHQVGMLRRVIETIETPLVLYMEQDTPLCTDMPIDWDAVTRVIETGDAGLVRFHHESVVPDAHKHLVHGQLANGFIRTSQWSQRPHVASVQLYRRVLDCFTPEAKTFIEDKMHSVCSEAVKLDGMDGWRQWPLTIYRDGVDSLKRSYHLDGRAGESKYEEQLVF